MASDYNARIIEEFRATGGHPGGEWAGTPMILNEFLSWRRRSLRQIPAGGAAEESASRAPDHAHVYAERQALLGELGKLPRRQRAVLVLRYYEDRDDAEIAELLGCTPGTVRGYASRALAALRIEMAPRPRAHA